MGRLFGTDGVRGIANIELTPELAFKIGQAGARILAKGKGDKIVIGKDGRISGDVLEAALIAGVCSTGADIYRVGIMPTPAIAYLTRTYGANAGVVISASHNPAEYNGIKFFDSRGFKLLDEKEDEIEKIVSQGGDFERSSGGEVGIVFEVDDAEEKYINHAMNTIPGDLEGLKIAIDCAFGAAYKVVPSIFRELGAEVHAFNIEPDGLNINKGCGSTNIDYVQEIVRTHNVDIGISFDGDADRVIAVDENGEVIDGDFIMAICAVYLNNLGKLVNNTLVTTVMTNFGFDLAMQRNGIKVVKTKVGDRYVLEKMMNENLAFGGEQSGHIIFLEHNTTGDGVITALQLISVMRQTAKKLSELKRVMDRLPQVLVNVEVSKKGKLNQTKAIWDRVKQIEERLGDKGRILVRESGTEPLVRVMVESEIKDEAKEIAESLAEVVNKELS
ncbi:MAG: phosphoglucosamine mutase [Actinobacteria bacterium]|nr:phosphoglucosamine mutase [Actinomycetota bacterium]